MNKFARNITTGIAAVTMIAILPACEREGPAERAGKSVDNAVDTAGEKIERAGEKIQDTASGRNEDKK